MRRIFQRRKFLVAAVFSVVLACFGGLVVPSGDTYADDALTTCASSGAAESLGWILCPIMDMLGGASEGIYNDAVKPNLQIEPQLFTGKGKATRDAWGTFRDIANGLLIALFLVVIFSQLTGVGIDNYGIKKILPKLIVAAILMNLSYWVCIVFVDLSNIIGNGIQSLFTGLGEALSYEEFTITEDAGEVAVGIASSAGSTLVSVAIIAALVAGGGYALFTNPAMLLGVLVAAIGVIVSIFFLFILLAVRQAAIVVLVVLSPLAIACYMLPNTKNIFDKWLKLFEALLLVYPICSLLVGGGNYVSRLLLKAGFGDTGLFGAITAMVVGIVPIFFFPTVLKNAFAGMGNIGAKITNMGDRVGGRLQGATQNSRAYKYAQERGAERQHRVSAGLDREGKPIQYDESTMSGRARKRIGAVLRGGDRGMARSRAQYLKDQDAEIREGRLMGVGFEAARVAQEKRAGADEVSDYMMLINNRTRNGEDEDALFDEFDKYMAAGDEAGAVAVARIAGRRKDTAARFAQEKLTGADTMGPSIANGYDGEMLQAVAKEMSTGENSGQYRTSSPLAFEFAAQLNRGKPGSKDWTQDYNTWINREGNVDNAMNNYITNSSEMVGLKNSSLNEIADMMNGNQMSEGTKMRLRNLAQDTINNKDVTGVWDTTKAESIQRIADWRPSGDGGAATASGAADAGAAATAAGTAGARAEAAGTAEVTNVAGTGGEAGGAAAAAAGGAAVGAAAAESAINRSAVQAPGAALGNGNSMQLGQGGSQDSSTGELTIEHDNTSRAGAATGVAGSTESRPQVAGNGERPRATAAAARPQAVATAGSPQATPAQSRLEIAHSMNDSRLRQAQQNVDAQNQGNRRWPGNPQTPRGI